MLKYIAKVPQKVTLGALWYKKNGMGWCWSLFSKVTMSRWKMIKATNTPAAKPLFRTFPGGWFKGFVAVMTAK